MPAFEYEATVKLSNAANGEEFTERGTGVAPTKTSAEEKLKELGLVPVKLTALRGLKGLIKSFIADVK